MGGEEKHVRTHRSDFSDLLVGRTFRVSRFYRFIPYFACRRHHPPDFAFCLREKGRRIKADSAFRTRDEEMCLRFQIIASGVLKSDTIPDSAGGCEKQLEGAWNEHIDIGHYRRSDSYRNCRHRRSNVSEEA